MKTALTSHSVRSTRPNVAATQQWQHICAISVPVGGTGRIRRRLLACAMKCCASQRSSSDDVVIQSALNTLNSTASAVCGEPRGSGMEPQSVSQSDVVLCITQALLPPMTCGLRLAV